MQNYKKFFEKENPQKIKKFEKIIYQLMMLIPGGFKTFSIL